MKEIYLKKLVLNNYRNFTELSLNFTQNVNIIIGSNGCGKTNILESISLLSPGKGLKSSNFDEICKHGCNNWNSQFSIESKLGVAEIQTSFNLQERNRRISYNGAKISSGELPNLLNLVWLTPQMEGIFSGPSLHRRKFLDRIVYNFIPLHAKRLLTYDHYIRERNKILANHGYQNHTSWLTSIEMQIAQEAVLIEKNRVDVIHQMQKSIDNLATDFPKAKLFLTELFKDVGTEEDIIQLYIQALQNNRKKDFYAGRATFGVHRSDLNVFHSYKNRSSKLCSTGEQKAMLISLTLASVDALLKNTETTPILLLDELFIHLDGNKKKQLYDYINSTKLQTFVTTTDILGIEYLAKESNIIEL
ncbi:MAG: DNA replication/repair protein RecF [Rickettsiales bacterium]|nr:MAG: DNA replication/repair protein RecF [Rickettsiales bacterium]